MFKAVAEAIDLPALALSWLESDNLARMLVDDQLLIRWSNSVAQTWLDSRKIISSTEGRLTVSRFDEDVRDLLHRARYRPEGTCVPSGDGGSHLILRARLVHAGQHSSIFGLSLRRSDDECVERAAGLAKAFGLTASEEGVLQLLFQGATAQQAADRLKVSVETVRTHIRRLYQKVGVGSREALLTQIRPFMMI